MNAIVHGFVWTLTCTLKNPGQSSTESQIMPSYQTKGGLPNELGGDTWRIWISMSFWNQFLGASECIVLGFFKHILCPSGAIHHWSVMACDCKCGQVLQAELAELKQRRQELREVASCLGWMGVWCFQSATFPCLACVRPSKLTKHTWRPRRSERPSWSRRSLVLFLPVEGTMYLLSEI